MFMEMTNEMHAVGYKYNYKETIYYEYFPEVCNIRS